MKCTIHLRRITVECKGCGNPEPWSVTNKKESISGRIYQECNRCFDPTISRNPDVYFKVPYWDENLMDWDEPSCNNNTGTFIRSKQHKAYVMKKLGVREAPDKKHGFSNADMYEYRVKK